MSRFLFLAALLLSLPGTPLAQPPSLSSLWPNADGASWEYRQRLEVADWSEGGADTSEAQVRLRLDGTLVVPGDIETQNLIEEVLSPAPAPSRGAPSGLSSLLRNVWIARPDLRKAIEARAPRRAAGEEPLWESVILHGGPYRKTTSEIATWRDNAVAVKSWIFLTSVLSPGSTFDLQLIPDLATDVYLHGTVGGAEDVTVPAGTFPGCLRVTYWVDYGESECVGPGGPDPLGTFRARSDGHILYAPNVGPVMSFEELTFTEVTGDCGVVPDEVAVRVVLQLTQGPVPVEPVTWGSLKARP